MEKYHMMVGRWSGLGSDLSPPCLLTRDAPVVKAGYAIVLERWTTVGAPDFPGPNVIVSPAALQTFLDENRVLCLTGTAGDRIYVVQRTGSEAASAAIRSMAFGLRGAPASGVPSSGPRPSRRPRR